MLRIPEEVRWILNSLEGSGYSAYAVGGCVRDSIMGRKPHDWDICTSAHPEETEACFTGEKILGTGKKHGTVTLCIGADQYEITTFRTETGYTDHRRPEHVTFVGNVADDLSRRDFTINAMAVGVDGVILDPFNGKADLQAGIIRCVGNPDARLAEDPLRILRGIRFAAQFGFAVETETEQGIRRRKELLQYVSAERIYVELTKLLQGDNAADILAMFPDVVGTVIPEILPMIGFWQHHPAHSRDVWGHTLEALQKAEADPLLRWAVLLHDIGKPQCFSMDDLGVGHFYGHNRIGSEMAGRIMSRLRAGNHVCDTIKMLVLHHEDPVGSDRVLARRWLNRYGVDGARMLLSLQKCDIAAHRRIKAIIDAESRLSQFGIVLEDAIKEKDCFSIKDLAVTGRDIISAGVPEGPVVGRILGDLLEEVLTGAESNTRPALLKRIKDLVKKAEW